MYARLVSRLLARYVSPERCEIEPPPAPSSPSRDKATYASPKPIEPWETPVPAAKALAKEHARSATAAALAT